MSDQPPPVDSPDWDAFLDDLRNEHPEAPGWVTLNEAAEAAGVSISALRTWYRSGDLPSRLVPGPHGEQRLVPLDGVLDKALASPRIRNRLLGQRSTDAEIAELRERVERLEAVVRDLVDGPDTASP